MRRAVSWVIVFVGFLSVGLSGCKNPNLSGAILHLDQDRPERAREAALQAISEEPENAEAYFVLGKAYAELDSTELARANLEKAIELAGDRYPEVREKAENAREHYWSERHNKGLYYANAAQEARSQGNDEEAKKNFRLALDRFKRARVYAPGKEETPRNMGTVYFNLGEIDSGLAVLKESRKLAEPGDERAAGILFDQYRRLGDQAASRRTDDGDIDRTGLSDAIRFYREAEELRSEDPDLLFSIGVIYYQLATVDATGRAENMNHAVGYFEKTLEVSPDDQEALYNAASLHMELKECEKGLALAKHLLDLAPREGKNYDLLGRLLDCMGKKTERVAGLVFSRALRSGEVVPHEEYRAIREKWGAQSDLVRKYREEGDPDEVRTFTDEQGGEYVTWFYWARGKAFAFYNGEKRYETRFKPQQLEEEPEAGTDE